MHLEDGTCKIFLNMKSKNGRPELVSLLQYMKKTSLDTPEIIVKDSRIERLDEIVTEIRQSEEWEDVKMTILEYGIEQGGTYQLIRQVCRKLRKGKPLVRIADELEEDYSTVAEICETAEKFAPDYDSDSVCEEYFNK